MATERVPSEVHVCRRDRALVQRRALLEAVRAQRDTDGVTADGRSRVLAVLACVTQPNGDRELEVDKRCAAEEGLPLDRTRVLLDLLPELSPDLGLLPLGELLGACGTRKRAEDQGNGRDKCHDLKDVPSQGHATPP